MYALVATKNLAQKLRATQHGKNYCSCARHTQLYTSSSAVLRELGQNLFQSGAVGDGLWFKRLQTQKSRI